MLTRPILVIQLTTALAALSGVAVQAAAEQSKQVSVCELKNAPDSYNHALLEVTGFVSHGFEDFSLFDPACLPWMGIWLEYGGTAKSGTMYCCGVTADRSRSEPAIVEGVAVPLVDDQVFRQFDERIRRPGGSIVHATLVGRFFAGANREIGGSDLGRGYGHMGCCTLFVIEQVKSVDRGDRGDVDYDPFPDQPEVRKVGCGYGELTELLAYDQWIAAQKRAEEGAAWTFEDPRRVAAEGLARWAGEVPAAGLKEKRRAQGRVVYEWTPGKGRKYMAVVGRPYLVSFYARDASRVAWVLEAAYQVSCGADE